MSTEPSLQAPEHCPECGADILGECRDEITFECGTNWAPFDHIQGDGCEAKMRERARCIEIIERAYRWRTSPDDDPNTYLSKAISQLKLTIQVDDIKP